MGTPTRHYTVLNMPKGYMVASIKISDMDQIKPFQEAVVPLLKEHGVTLIARGSDIRENANGVEEGSLTVIFEFESYEKATEFYECEAYQKIIPLRQSCAKSTYILLPGV